MILARSITGEESAVLLALCGIVTILLRVQYKQRKASNMLTRSPTKPRDRRRLGRGQYPQQTPVTPTITGSASTASCSFSQAVIVSGPLPLTVGTLTYVSQSIVSATLVVVTMSGAVSGQAYTLPTDPEVIRGEKGQTVAAAAGTFS